MRVMAPYRPRRPRDAPGDRLRQIRVGVNLCGVEHDLVEDFARANDLSVGAAARQLILIAAVGEKLRSGDETALDRRLARTRGEPEARSGAVSTMLSPARGWADR